MPRAPHKCSEAGCPQLIPAGAGAKCPEHRRESAGRFGSVRNSRARTSTAGHRARRQSTLRQAGGQCQIRYDAICTGSATVFDHIIGLRMWTCCRQISARASRWTRSTPHIGTGKQPANRVRAGRLPWKAITSRAMTYRGRMTST